MEHYDYIIAGGGASGLLLAYNMANDPFFDDKKILIIEKAQKTVNDRTWCFWEAPGGEFDHLVVKKWDHAIFKSPSVQTVFSMHPFQYKMIRSGKFYRFMHECLAQKNNIEIHIGEIVSLEDMQEHVQVETNKNRYRCKKAFTSIFEKSLLYKQDKYPVLQQHFLGWFIKTDTPLFDETTITLMDFDIPQQGNTRFMYVLPVSATEALVEYTLFSGKLLPEAVYEEALRTYLKNTGVIDYSIVEKEKGSIPMSCYDFSRHHSENVLYIGTAGGWTKPSTGYTFLNTVRKTKALIPYIKKDLSFAGFDKKNRFRYYDLLLLDVLYRRNDLGSKIFSALFKRNSPRRIFRFLDEQSSFLEELKIISTLPPRQFIVNAFRRIF